MASQTYTITINGTDGDGIFEERAESTDGALAAVKDRWETTISANILVHIDGCKAAATFQVNEFCLTHGDCQFYRIINGEVFDA